MILSNKIDLISYIQRTQLQKETLFVSQVFSDDQKEALEKIYEETICICQTALQNVVAKEIDVKATQTL